MRTLDDFLKFVERHSNYELRRPARPDNAGQPHRFNLASIARLLELLQRPDLGVAARILVAGTHGKGSTCHWIDGLLRAQGLRVGRYSSPHVESLLERVTIDGVAVDERHWVDAACPVATAVEQIEVEGFIPTFFDIVTALAFVLMRDAGVDATVLEVGMGGRLDSTNSTDPTMTVITEIDLDHTDALGDDTARIAREKAGILRAGVPLVAQVSDDQARATILAAAEEIGASPIHVHGGELALPDGWPVPSAGHHQRQNAALAVTAVEVTLGRRLTRAEVERGLATAGAIPARCQELRAGSGTQWIIDGGHTPGAARALAALLESSHRGDHVVCVLGIASDKDALAYCEPLAPLVDEVFTTCYDSPRAMPADQLAVLARRAGMTGARPGGDVASALAAADHAARACGRRTLRLICGSFYLAGEVLSKQMLAAL